MSDRYQLLVYGDSPDVDQLRLDVAAFVAQLKAYSNATATLEIVAVEKPSEPIDVATEAVTIQLDISDSAMPVIASIRGGKYVGVGATLEGATADLAATVAADAVSEADPTP